MGFPARWLLLSLLLVGEQQAHAFSLTSLYPYGEQDMPDHTGQPISSDSEDDSVWFAVPSPGGDAGVDELNYEPAMPTYHKVQQYKGPSDEEPQDPVKNPWGPHHHVPSHLYVPRPYVPTADAPLPQHLVCNQFPQHPDCPPQEPQPTCCPHKDPDQEPQEPKVPPYQPPQGPKVLPYQGPKVPPFQPPQGPKVPPFQPPQGPKVPPFQPPQGPKVPPYQPPQGPQVPNQYLQNPQGPKVPPYQPPQGPQVPYQLPPGLQVPKLQHYLPPYQMPQVPQQNPQVPKFQPYQPPQEPKLPPTQPPQEPPKQPSPPKQPPKSNYSAKRPVYAKMPKYHGKRPSSKPYYSRFPQQPKKISQY